METERNSLTGIERIFIAELPKKMVYFEGSNSLVDLDGMVVKAILTDKDKSSIIVDEKLIRVIQNVNTMRTGITEVIIGHKEDCERLRTSFFVEVVKRPAEEV